MEAERCLPPSLATLVCEKGAWSSLIQLDWLATELQASSCLPPELGLAMALCSQLFHSWGSKLRSSCFCGKHFAQ